MSDQPAPTGDGVPCPFFRLMALLIERHKYLARVVDETCKGRSAYRLTGSRVPPLTYVLADESGAEQAAGDFLAFLTREPFRNTCEDWLAAERESRELAAKAGIPFTESDPVIREAVGRGDHQYQMIVMGPSADVASIPGRRLAGPVRLSQDLLDEIIACQLLFRRLKAFSDHARGLGLIPKAAGGESSPVGTPQPSKRVKRDKKADARDKWMYQQATGKTPKQFKAIMQLLRQLADTKGWTPLGSPTAVQQAITGFSPLNTPPCFASTSL